MMYSMNPLASNKVKGCQVIKTVLGFRMTLTLPGLRDATVEREERVEGVVRKCGGEEMREGRKDREGEKEP